MKRVFYAKMREVVEKNHPELKGKIWITSGVTIKAVKRRRKI